MRSSSRHRHRHKRAKPRSDSLLREREIKQALEQQREDSQSTPHPTLVQPVAVLKGYEYDAATDRYYKVDSRTRSSGYRKDDNCSGAGYRKDGSSSMQSLNAGNRAKDSLAGLTTMLLGRESAAWGRCAHSSRLSSYYLCSRSRPSILNPAYTYYMRGAPPSALVAQPFEEVFQPCHFTDASYHCQHGLLYSTFEHQDVFLYSTADNTSRLVHSNRSDLADLLLNVPTTAANCPSKLVASISKLDWLSSDQHCDQNYPLFAYVGEAAGRGCVFAVQSCGSNGGGLKAALGSSGWIEAFTMSASNSIIAYSCRDEVYRISIEKFFSLASTSSSNSTNRLDIVHRPQNRVFKCTSKFNTVMEIASNPVMNIDVYAQRNGEVVACDDRVDFSRSNNIAIPMIASMKYCVDYITCLQFSPTNIIISDINNRIATYDMRYIMKSADSERCRPVNVISLGQSSNSIRKKRFFVDSKEEHLVASSSNNKLHIYNIKSPLPTLIDCKELTDISRRWHGENYTLKFPSLHRSSTSGYDPLPLYAISSYTFSNGSIYESNLITMNLPQ